MDAQRYEVEPGVCLFAGKAKCPRTPAELSAGHAGVPPINGSVGAAGWQPPYLPVLIPAHLHVRAPVAPRVVSVGQPEEHFMNRQITLGLAMLVGAAIGGVAVQGLHAQAKPPAYYVAELDVTNEDAYNKEWAPKVSETVKAAGGDYLARGTNITAIEGTAPKRLVVSKFDNIDKLKAWRDSAAYKSLLPIRDKAVKTVRAYAIEGVN
jgi:uncharacterized protein (DUF1330 family)